MTGLELGRISIPCRAKRYTTKDGPDTWWPTPEPPHRINQLFLEPVLFARAVGRPGLRILSRTSASDFEQIEDGVLAIGKNLDTGKTSEIFARYSIGCDGAHPTVRRRMLPGPEGEAVRERIGREAYQTNVGQFCCGRLNFGYFYAESPIIAYDGEPAPAYTMNDFRQSTVPGCRTPHLWLRDGRSFYDALGSEFTLLRFDPSVEVGALVSAAADRGVLLAVLDVDADEAAQLYPRKLLLSSPDQHVAWRGDAPPNNPTALIDLIRGATIGA